MSPSCTIRYADRSSPRRQGDGSPCDAQVDRCRPRPRRGAAGRGRRVPGGAPARRSSPSSRIALSRRRISVSAVRPASSTLRRASRSAAAVSGSRCRTAPTWRTITLTACATTSCSSRAIRARSSATASRAAPRAPAPPAPPGPRPPPCAPCARAVPTPPASRWRTSPGPRSGRRWRTGPVAHHRRGPATTITSPTRASSALRWAPSSTAAPIPAIRMPAPFTISWPSRKERPVHRARSSRVPRRGTAPQEQDQYR